MKKIFLSLVAVSMLAASCAQQSANLTEQSSKKDSAAFSVGVFIAEQCQRYGTNPDLGNIEKAVNDVYNSNSEKIQKMYSYVNAAEIAQQAFHGMDSTLNPQLIIAGVKASMDKATDLDIEGANQVIMSYIEEKAQKASEDFMVNIDKMEGIKKTDSGIRYIVEKQGEGQITDKDKVKVDYTLYGYDGKEIDSSVSRKEPLEVQLPSGVVPGFAEAIQLVGVGGKLKVWIPSELGYGAQGAGRDIAPNQILIFDIEVLEKLPADKK